MAVLDLSPLNTILKRLEGVADRLEGASGGAPAGGPKPVGGAAAAVASENKLTVAFDAFLKEKVAPLTAAAEATTFPDVIEGTKDFVTMLNLLRELFAATDKCAAPADADWNKVLTPMIQLSDKAGKACDNRSEFFSNRTAVKESMQLMMLPTQKLPAPHVKNTLEAMDFHANKVMMKKDPPQTAWIKAFKLVFADLAEFCKEEMTTGPPWKAGGTPAAEYFAAQPLGSGKPAAAGKGAGKGPPIPKGGNAAPPPPDPSAPKAAPAGGGMGDVFAGIKAGTGGLKKVSDDQKTKNRDPNDRSALVVAKAAAPARAPPAGQKGKGPRGPPILELQRGTNWVLENQEGGTHILEEGVEQSHLVIIINCKNITVKLPNKVKNICIDGCHKVALIANDVVSSIEAVNSDRLQLQTLGKVHSFAIDKCDGVNIWLCAASLGADVTSSKSSEMNVTIPDPNGEDGDIIEMPIPEQFVTKLVGTKLVTGVSDLYSS